MSLWDVRLAHRYGTAAGAWSLDVALRSDARRLMLAGPSGAGKTQTLRMLAGLVRPAHGFVSFGGDVLLDTARAVDVPARRRGLAYMFQEHALFPHLDVACNVAFGLHHGWLNPLARRARSDPRVQRWIDAFGLGAVARHHPHQLSGGQRQRVALARALVAGPRALLLDEPFSALDVALRDRLRDELRALQAATGLPIVIVSHDPDDARDFADEVVRFDGARIVAAGA